MSAISREDVVIKGMPTDQAATAFAAGQVDAVGAFPPYTPARPCSAKVPG